MSGVHFVKRQSRRDGEDGDDRDATNDALKFASKALRGESARVDGTLLRDFQAVMDGNAIYLRHFHCAARDYGVLCALGREMEAEAGRDDGGSSGMVNWSKHLKSENPEFSETFHKIVDAMATYFDVEVYATRMNFYRDGTDWKPFHHDSHAYGGRAQREDFTMGASFGGSRELVFLHEPSGQTFTFPQNNGDVFAFTSDVNKAFKHGVPKAAKSGQSDPRFSIIAWGRRRSVNSRNGGGEVTGTRDGTIAENYREEPKAQETGTADTLTKPRNELVMGTGEVSALIRAFIDKQASENAHALSVSERIANKSKQNAKLNVKTTTKNKNTNTSASLALDLMHILGEGAYLKLRTSGREWQEGHISIESFYAQATRLCGGDANILLQLAAYLPDLERRSQLLKYHDVQQRRQLEF